MNTSKTQSSVFKIPLFVGNVMLGIIAFFMVIIKSFDEESPSDKVLYVMMLEIGGAFITAAVTSVIQPRSALNWSTGFALPMVGYGCIMGFLGVCGDELEALLVTLLGFATLAVSLLGAWLGRRLRGVQTHDIDAT
jgi:hypothetical protein